MQWWNGLNKREKRLFYVVLAILIYGIFDFSSNFSHYKQLLFGESTPMNSKMVMNADSLRAVLAIKKAKPPVPYSPDAWKKDPFRITTVVRVQYQTPATPVKTSTFPELHLRAISISPFSRVALINGKIVHVGDWVENAQIIHIFPDKVVLRFQNGRQFTLKLP